MRVDALTVVLDTEGNFVFSNGNGKIYGFICLGMDNGIFNQIDDNLFDKNGVHGDKEHFFRYGSVDFYIGKAFFYTL